jgi:glycosyltransferase involved in cell wall biosynthesis
MTTKINSEPLVAIGVPVYNGGAYLRECLDSILKQTYQNWKCVIVDNQSTDDTNKISREFVDLDKRFDLIVNEHFVDQTTNWNISYEKSAAEARYFKIVCADDWIFPAYLEKMVRVMDSDPSVGFCSSYRIDGKSVRCSGLDIYDGNYYNGKEILSLQLGHKIDITGSVNTLLFSKKVLQRLDYHPEIFRPGAYHIDTILAYDVLNVSNLGFVFEVLSYTRRHNETYTSQISDRFKTGYYLREYALRKFINNDPSYKDAYKRLRLDYAYFLLMKRINNDRKCIDWHNKYLEKKINPREYLMAFLTRNYISRQFAKL